MGLYGLLIVDPPAVRDPLTGRTRVPAYRGGPFYDVEQLWVFDDMDPRWHLLDKSSGICGEDAGLHKFEPKYFLVNGKPTVSSVPADHAGVIAKPGDKILIRMLNASYSVLKIKMVCGCKIISVDGHPVGDEERPWSQPRALVRGDDLYLTTAGRHEILIDTTGFTTDPNPDTVYHLDEPYYFEVEFQHWATRKTQNKDNPGPSGMYLGKMKIPLTMSKIQLRKPAA
jgi:FtsP/CotA-like multicopper oxidase with cupredoxin domain